MNGQATATENGSSPKAGPIAKLSEYADRKGKVHPMIVLMKSEEDKFPFQFGLGKAELVIALFEEIKRFRDSKGVSL